MSAADLTEEKLKTVIRTWEVMGSCHLNPRDVLELLVERDGLKARTITAEENAAKAGEISTRYYNAHQQALAVADQLGGALKALYAHLLDEVDITESGGPNAAMRYVTEFGPRIEAALKKAGVE